MTKTRNKLKIMGLVLTMVLLIASLGVFSLTASAAGGDVASVTVGGTTTSYDTFDAAITAAQSCTDSDKAVVKLLADIAMGDTYLAISGGVFTIDLNGFELSGTGSTSLLSLTGSANVTIIDSGADGAIRTNSKAIRARDTSIVTINGGTFHSADSHPIWFQSTGKLTVNDGVIIGGSYGICSTKGITTINGGNIHGTSEGIICSGTLTVYGGTVTSDYEAVLVDSSSASVTINGGSFTGGSYAVYGWSSCSATINGGEFSGGEYDLGGMSSVKVNDATFPEGLSVKDATLNAILGSGYAYWAGDTMLAPADDATEITDKGDITVKAACTHESGTKSYTNNGDDHTYTYSCCNLTVTEDHNYTDCVCPCGAESHIFIETLNGFCTACDTYQPAVDSNSDGYYEIGNAGQLFWFAQQVNVEGNREIKGVLTADIDLENRPWTPIGETGENNKNFRGVFDGQNHTIKGLYVEGTKNGVGFFGEVRTGTVKNFTIYGEVVVNTEVDYVGGVIGSICGLNGENDLYRNGAEIQNITSYVNLTAKAHGVGMIGGFVGYANHQSLIENCSWYGTFDAGIYRVDSGAGGFIGKIQENTSEVTIRNCAAYGTIKTNYEKNSFNDTPTIYMGGFLSFSNTGAGTVLENCLFAGKFERGENLTDQAFLGAFGTLRSVNSIKNCYYLGDDGLEAVHSDSNLKPGSDNVEITSVTKAQLLSGEVAYKLGEHFGQILEGENRQSYPVLGETKVEDSQRFEIYGQQLNIGADLSMKYYVMGYAPEFNSKSLYMEFSHNGVKTKVCAGEPNADGFYVFILEGINPQCMGDSIYAKLYYNETEVANHGCEDGKEYSVEKNLLNLLEEYKDDATLVALINDTLAYGKAASEYKKHDTMTGDYTVSDSTIPDATVTPNGAFTGYTVVFGHVNFIKVSVELADGYTLYLDGTNITSQLVGGIFKTDGIAPTEFDNKFSFEIKNGDTTVQTFAVSVNDYIGAQKNSATMGNLAKALYNYGVSAEIYNHVKTGGGDHYYVDNVCACGKLYTIDATAMTADELKAAVADQLAAGKTNINVALAADAEQEMFSAIWTAFSESTAADGSINLTISGAKTVPDYGFFDNDNYFENGEKNIAGDKLKSLTLPDVETIGDFAFSACTYLESVNLPQVVTIGECAFNQWKKGTKLTSLNLPNATTIGDWAFAYSSLLTSVNLPKVTSIGVLAFGYCDLRTLILPEVTTIDGEAFLNNDNLVSCSAPKATTIDYYPWGSNGTSKLERLELTAVGDFTLGNNLFAYTPTEQIDLVLNKDKETQVTQNEDGTATWKTTNSNGGKLEYTFKSITFAGE